MRRLSLCLAPVRAMTPGELLTSVRSDPGMTAEYYANRYFGKGTVMKVQACLWGELKRHGKVTMERTDGDETPPRWYPVFGSPRPHRARWHNPLDEDLSVLDQTPTERRAEEPTPQRAPHANVASSHEPLASASSVDLEAAVVRAVQAEPGMDIQYYIHKLPDAFQRDAPLAFKRLREAGLLERSATSQGTFVWH